MKTTSLTFAALTCGEIFASAFIMRSEPVLQQASPQESWTRLALCVGCGNGNGNGNIGNLNGNFNGTGNTGGGNGNGNGNGNGGTIKGESIGVMN